MIQAFLCKTLVHVLQIFHWNKYLHTQRILRLKFPFSFFSLIYPGQNKVEFGSTVFKVLCYKSEGRYFDSLRCFLTFFIYIKYFRSHYGPGVDSASNRNEYQKYFLG